MNFALKHNMFDLAILAVFDRINAIIATRREYEKWDKAERGGSLIVFEYRCE